MKKSIIKLFTVALFGFALMGCTEENFKPHTGDGDGDDDLANDEEMGEESTSSTDSLAVNTYDISDLLLQANFDEVIES